MTGKRVDPRCTTRDGRNQRCLVRGEHDTIINSKGQQAVAHYTEHSMWSVPLHDLQVVTAFAPDPEMLGKLLDRARHATPEDVIAGGANNEEELLQCLRLGFIRATEGDEPGTNVLGFVIWPNGNLAFMAGWNHAKSLQVQDILTAARQGADT